MAAVLLLLSEEEEDKKKRRQKPVMEASYSSTMIYLLIIQQRGPAFILRILTGEMFYVWNKYIFPFFFLAFFHLSLPSDGRNSGITCRDPSIKKKSRKNQLIDQTINQRDLCDLKPNSRHTISWVNWIISYWNDSMISFSRMLNITTERVTSKRFKFRSKNGRQGPGKIRRTRPFFLLFITACCWWPMTNEAAGFFYVVPSYEKGSHTNGFLKSDEEIGPTRKNTQRHVFIIEILIPLRTHQKGPH